MKQLGKAECGPTGESPARQDRFKVVRHAMIQTVFAGTVWLSWYRGDDRPAGGLSMDEQASGTKPRAPRPADWVSKETGRPKNLSLSVSALLIVLLPMFVYFFADIFFENFANPHIIIPPPDAPVLPESEVANRYFFLASYLALIAITTGICLYFWSDVRSDSRSAVTPVRPPCRYPADRPAGL
jgi:hypothetical protein